MTDSHCSGGTSLGSPSQNPTEPTLLVIMGSGETTPSLAHTHRQIFDRLGPGERVMLDTPYGLSLIHI